MREIRFRGKKVKTKKWVYGYYVERTDDHDKSHKIYNPNNGTWHIVDRETVGQYTGHKDKNGWEIYKDDLLETSKRKLRKELFQVEWSDMNSGWRAFHIDEFVEMEAYMFKSSKIIGNLHDNPELLK